MRKALTAKDLLSYLCSSIAGWKEQAEEGLASDAPERHLQHLIGNIENVQISVKIIMERQKIGHEIDKPDDQ